MKTSTHLRNKRCCARERESGIALIMALICLFIVSTLAVGVMFSTQSEIWTTANYRATTQARYMAEAGAQQALNYLQSQFATPSDFTTKYNVNNMPITWTAAVTCNGTAYSANSLPVILATTGVTPQTQYGDTYGCIEGTGAGSQEYNFQNYFASATTQIPFANLIANCSGAQCPHFDVSVQLLTASPTTSGSWIMRWKVVSQGSLNTIGTTSASAGKARVQVVEVVDSVMVTSSSPSSSSSPTYDAAVFATGTGCGTISMSGGQYTNSYNSSTQLGNSSPSVANTGGDIATYGNVSLTNGAYVIGNVFTPFYNVGLTGTYGIAGGPTWPGLNSTTSNPYSAHCSTAAGGTEWAVNEDNSGSSVGCTAANSGSCSQKTYALPSPAPTFPTPCLPSGNCASVPATVAANTAACSGYRGLCNGGNGSGYGVNQNACDITIPPSTLASGAAGGGAANFGAVTFGSCAVITLQAGTYNFDSLLVSNGASIVLASYPVVINILDQGTTAIPLNVSGGIVANNGQAPADLTFAYAGTKPINLTAGANMFATVYAPNAPVTLSGNAGLYGAVVSSSATFSGSGHVIYDTSLAGQHWNVTTTSTTTSSAGNLHVDEFSWSAF